MNFTFNKLFAKAAMLLSFLVLFSEIFAQIPSGYYLPAEGKSNAELKTALHEIIEKGTRYSYGSGSGKSWSGFEVTDRRADGKVWDMYSNGTYTFPGNGGVPSGMNIEHSVAKSWWGGTQNDAYKDLFHLNPSLTAANSAKSNYPPGLNDGEKYSNGSLKVGLCKVVGYSGLSFEPADEYKGDFARAYLYMFTCYEDFNWQGTNAPNMLDSNKWPMLKPWAAKLMLQWHRQDPVSEKELNRQEAVYNIQHNRNPYIDYPQLVEYLWGERVGQPFVTVASNDPAILSPASNSTVVLPQVHYTSSTTIDLVVKAAKLKDDLALRIDGTDASLFTLNTTTLTKDEAESGTIIKITFQPVKVGSYGAQLTISGGGVANSTIVNLTAIATEQFMSLPPKDVRSNEFTACWTPSSQYTDFILNVYRVVETGQQDVTLTETTFQTGMSAGWSSVGYTDFMTNPYIRLASGSQSGSISTAEIDLSKGGKLELRAKRYNNDTDAKISVDVDGQVVTDLTTAAGIQTFTYDLPISTDASVVNFSAKSGKRAYLDYIRVYTGGTKKENVSIEGHPRRTGNVFEWTVSGLDPLTSYYYTITPVGGQVQESLPMRVVTSQATDVDVLNNRIVVRSVANQISINGLKTGSSVRIYNLSGNLIEQYAACEGTLSGAERQPGIYFVQVVCDKQIQNYKVSL